MHGQNASRIVLLVLLMLAVVSLVTISGMLVAKGKPCPEGAKSTSAAGTVLVTTRVDPKVDEIESVMLEDGVPVIPIIPLHWNRVTKTYDIKLIVGSSEVTAAFDTGSAGMIVRTPACKSCRGGAKVYTPPNDGVKDATQTLCRSSISYVSQTNVLQMYSDTVTFRRLLVKQGSGTPVHALAATNGTLRQHREAAPLVITGFPIGGMVESYGNHDSVNVFGISGVKSVNQAKAGGSPSFPTSTCRATATSTYECALLHSIAAANPNAPLRWSIKFSADRSRGGASVALGTGQAYRGQLITAPAVRQLPNAPSDMVGTPWRYYVIEVLHARYADAETNGHHLPDFPRYLIVDTATTQFMIPGTTSPASLASRGLIVTLNDEDHSELQWLGKASGTSLDNRQDYDTDTPLFASMPEAIAKEFSTLPSSRDGGVGILGALAMRGRYIEFAFSGSETEADTRTVSFAFA